MDTFCVLPWYSSELPSNTPCCLLPNNTNIDQLKIDLLNGIKSSACSKCWVLEEQGEKSRRLLENEFLDYKLDRDLILIREDCKTKIIDPIMYQIKTSNLCNQACVTCDSSASTKWAELETKMGVTPKSKLKINASTVNINYADAKKISLLGGEPFFDPTTFEILERLIKHNNTDCFISLVTNGSIVLKQTQLDLLSKFSDLNICISIDGIEKRFEYLRWPAKWNTLLDNLKRYREITKNISISYTISSLNALYYNETINWFKQNNLRYNHNIVNYPQWIGLDNTPLKIKEALHNTSVPVAWMEITGKETTLDSYQNYLQAQDQAKKINIKDYLPEVWEILNDSASVGK